MVDVMIRLTEPEVEGLWTHLGYAVARGEVTTQEAFDQTRADLQAERRSLIAEAQDGLLDAIARNGGATTSVCQNMYCLAASLPVASIALLGSREDVARIDLVVHGSGDVIRGREIRIGSQIDQYTDNGFDGENGAGAAKIFAIVDDCGIHDEHIGFKQDTGTGFRYISRSICSASNCTSTSNYTNQNSCSAGGGQHMTAVAGLVFGDLGDGQDSAVTVAFDRINRSGYAPEAFGRIYSHTTSVATVEHTFDSIAALSSQVPQVVNQSWGANADDPNCLGESAFSRAANDLYEDNILLIKSAGNNGNSVLTDCTVGSPGSAIGAFVVGAHEAGYTDATNVRSDAIASYSSRGGSTSAEGKGRTIVDITAFGQRNFQFDTSGGYGNTFSGTSMSTPVVTGTAIDYLDLISVLFGNTNPDAGYIHANLLLMGDRVGNSGSDLTIQFANLYGAGRLKARRFDSIGMDAPFQYLSGESCVGSGQAVDIPVNGGSVVPAGVDVFKAVAWFYDRRHETGTTIDDVDLRLISNGTTIVASSSSSSDEKERVFYNAPAGKTLTLRLAGTPNITADLEGCGTDKMKVYWAFFYEDSARDDADGPTAAAIETE